MIECTELSDMSQLVWHHRQVCEGGHLWCIEVVVMCIQVANQINIDHLLQILVIVQYINRVCVDCNHLTCVCAT